MFYPDCILTSYLVLIESISLNTPPLFVTINKDAPEFTNFSSTSITLSPLFLALFKSTKKDDTNALSSWISDLIYLPLKE